VENNRLVSKFSSLMAPSRKIVVAAAIAITTAIIIDYLATRQMFPYNNFSGAIIFGLTIVTAAIGSFIILKYVSQASADIRASFLTECSRS
jgi:ammonia channel protein AmtB